MITLHTSRRHTHRTWGTSDELDFLAGLGMKVYGSRSTTSRFELLKRYKTAMRLRREWGSINVATLVCYVRAALAEESFGTIRS